MPSFQKRIGRQLLRKRARKGRCPLWQKRYRKGIVSADASITRIVLGGDHNKDPSPVIGSKYIQILLFSPQNYKKISRRQAMLQIRSFRVPRSESGKKTDPDSQTHPCESIVSLHRICLKYSFGKIIIFLAFILSVISCLNQVRKWQN